MWVKCLLPKCEGLSLVPRHECRNQEQGMHCGAGAEKDGS